MRIYLTCLASYNAGKLHGKWVDATQGIDHIRDELAEILRTSPEPNVMVACPACNDFRPSVADLGDAAFTPCETCHGKGQVPSAEEWAIHDFEDFGPWRISEYESLETVAAVAKAAEQSGEPGAFLAWFVENEPSTTDATNALSSFQDNYCGEWDSERAYAENLVDDLGDLDPDSFLARYFDYEAFARDLFINDYSSVDAPRGVYVFRRS